MKRSFRLTLLCAGCSAVPLPLYAGIDMSPAFTYAEEGGSLDPLTDIALASNGGVASAKDVINAGGYPAHQTEHLNDGLYSNDYSWIGESAPSWAVISFGAAPVTVASFAYGRANAEPSYADRSTGTTTIQYTTEANPDATTPEGSWTTIGTITLTDSLHDGFTAANLRHRYNINTPVSATGIRFITPGGNCLDEIELYSTAGEVFVPPPPPPPQAIDLAPATGYTLTWDGNNGSFNGAPVPGAPANLALADGATAFANSVIAAGSLPPHQIAHLNDGSYGNPNSWIGEGPDNHAGIALAELSNITGIAWGRDNTGTNFGDRWASLYTLQRTTVAAPDQDTPDTGTAATGWETIGTVAMNFNGSVGGSTFTGSIRHEFALGVSGGGDLQATGLRLVCAADGVCIDEIEVYGSIPPPPPPPPLVTAAEPGYVISWDGNDGVHFAETEPYTVPENLALAANGATAIARGHLGPELGLAFHLVTNLNDGLYGNANSWIGGSDAAPWYAGVVLPTVSTITSFAFGRDNAADNNGAGFGDRWAGNYTIQITQDGINWSTIGTVNLANANADDVPGGGFTGRLRHEIQLATTGGPLQAAGVRLLVPGTGVAGGTDIDEFEIYGTAGTVTVPAPPALSPLVISPEPGYQISWDGNDGAGYATEEPYSVPDNLALAANGGTPIASGELGPELGIGYHLITNLNDGSYGNSYSWIGGSSDAAPFFAGVMLPEVASITSIAWGRDNAADNAGGSFIDRWAGNYTIEYTVNGTDWISIGSVSMSSGSDTVPGEGFTGWLRHEFQIGTTTGPLEAMGVRLLVPGTGIGGGTDIDELELYGVSTPVDFAITGITQGPGDAISLTFSSLAGHVYTVEYSENLIDWDAVSPAITGEAGTTTFSSQLNRTALPGLSGTLPARVYFRVRP